MKIIRINSIRFSYKKSKDIFCDFSLQLEQQDGAGKVTAIMGSSGSGKSTLMKLLLGIEKPLSGNIEIVPLNPVFSYVPQEPVLFEHLSIEDNARYFQFAGAYKKRFNENLYKELVKSLGLEEIVGARKSVLELSGGQKQRLSLLRALCIEPDFLLLDEPCNGLDAEVKRSFLNKLREITQRYGLFVLYITHHKLEAQLIADEVAYLVQDRNLVVKKAAKGTILEFMEKPPVLEAAYIFRFPDVKILHIIKLQNGEISIANHPDNATHHWLIEEGNILVSSTDGWPFKVISKSPFFSVIRHEESETEWMVRSMSLNGYESNMEIKLKIIGDHIEYNDKKLIIDTK